jgi:hypothetical protein
MIGQYNASAASATISIGRARRSPPVAALVAGAALTSGSVQVRAS